MNMKGMAAIKNPNSLATDERANPSEKYKVIIVGAIPNIMNL